MVGVSRLPRWSGVTAVVVAIVVITAGSTEGSLRQRADVNRSPTPFADLQPTPVPGQPVTGFGFSAVDDPSAHQLVLFGGVDSYAMGNPPVGEASTMAWDGAANEPQRAVAARPTDPTATVWGGG